MIDAKSAKILLVEDDAADAELALHVFKQLVFPEPVAVATDGAEALEFIFGNPEKHHMGLEHPPSVVFLDLKLPKVDGFEVLRRLKADDRTRHVPVVILTSSRELKDVRRAFELGANSYVVKPVDAEQYNHVVSTVAHYWLQINESEEYNAHNVIAAN